MLPFREHHLFTLLKRYDKEEKKPFDQLLREYFKDHTSLGSKDRLEILQNAYSLMKWRSLLDLEGQKLSWQERFERLKSFSIEEMQKNRSPWDQVAAPQELFDLVKKSYGEKEAKKLLSISNEEAPITIRVNPAKISRDELLERLQEQYRVRKTAVSPHGIVFSKRQNFFAMPEFKQGLFEVQDEGSQLICELMDIRPKQHVLDYCAGAGGKSLGFAYKMEGKGQLYLHDVRSFALEQAKKRLKRASIQNMQIIESESSHLEKLKKKMDWTLVDAPCSGTGTMRRNPDMKWRFNQEMVMRLQGEQRKIFEKALSFVRPKGYIVYATCSILEEENEQQVEHFMNTYDLVLEKSLKTTPKKGEMDGFFAQVFRRS